ncbi:DNA methyltransferase [Amaricoccus macauensis]|nr:DNA methyltransferase [Amaricoccus macauensis]
MGIYDKTVTGRLADLECRMLERFFTLQELEETLKLSLSTLRRAVKTGELQHVRVGKKGQIRVSEASVQAYLAKSKTTPDAQSIALSPADRECKNASDSSVRTLAGRVGEKQSYKILNADVSVGLRSLPSNFVHTAVTSPAYFWQRDYECEGQIGHEATIEEYVQALVEPFKELKRVLRPDGVFFLNIGDAYYNAKGRPHGRDRKNSGRQLAREKLRAVDGPGLGLPRKSLIGLPWRVATAMQSTGWTLRSAVIWERPGSLGEPTAHDRPHRTYENVFIFSKGPKYYFNRAVLGGEEDIWRIAARPENPHSHCAPFPTELVDRCLACGCPEEGTVLDPFLGSGTTAISALRSGRSVVGIELNSKYCSEAEQRIGAEFVTSERASSAA